MPPDQSLRRVGAVVERYDASHDTVSAMLWIEFKRPSGSVRQVALDAAGRCIRTNDLESVYVMTPAGVSFRVWSVYGSHLSSLVPFHGGPADATRSQYVKADFYEAEVLSRFAETVKAYSPLRRAPVIPTQSLPLTSYGQIEYSQVDDSVYPTIHEAGPSGTLYYGQHSAPSIDGYGQASPAGDQCIKVQVSWIGHSWRSTEYDFSDFNGNQKRSTKDDWREVIYKGKAAWVNSRRGVTYYTRDRIG
ncbi:hypothetical protein FMUND_9330 [Fusarium mundagurra]|uniref:Uncharacterized protein n=1 Tax=Fusarium mundagurra TaxID=1567541 RepID=A0A8H6DBM6_9HYPO|nr:hypothetical protein FMUND_9330 [Fusarium mundagurra]